MTVPLRPLFDKILIKRPEEFSETEGGIIIPETSREKAMNGEVVSIGADVKHVKKGQRVMFAKYAGTDITFDDENQYLLLEEKAVLGIMARIDEDLLKTIYDLELDVRSDNALKNANICYTYQLIQKTDSQLLKIRNFGRHSLNDVKGALKEFHLELGTIMTDEEIYVLEDELRKRSQQDVLGVMK